MHIISAIDGVGWVGVPEIGDFPLLYVLYSSNWPNSSGSRYHEVEIYMQIIWYRLSAIFRI